MTVSPAKVGEGDRDGSPRELPSAGGKRREDMRSEHITTAVTLEESTWEGGPATTWEP